MIQNRRFNGLSTLAIFGGLTLLSTSALATEAAQSSLFAESGVGIDQIGEDGNFDLSSQFSTDGTPVPATVTNQTFTGMDANGNTQTMTFNGVNRASASFGGLHIFASGSITNSYYNPANPKADDGSGTLNPAGSPDAVYSLGFADFTDVLQYGGALQSGYKAQYIFHVDGTNTESFPYTTASLGVSIAGNPDESFFAGAPGFNSDTWATQTYEINGVTPQTVHVQFSAQFVTNMYENTDGSNISGSSDFSETLTLEGIEVVDANGDPVSGVTISSGSGTSYSVLPEPTTLAILLPGALVLGRRNRRK